MKANMFLARLKATYTFSFSNISDFVLGIVSISMSIVLGLLANFSIFYALLVAFAFTLVVFILIHPILLGYLLIAAIALTSGMQRGALIPFFIPNEAILFFSLVMSIPFIFIRQLKTTKSSMRINLAIFILIAGTVFIPLFAYYFRGISLTSSEITRLGSPVQYILLYFLFLFLPKNETEVYGLVRFMWICACIVAFVGLIQVANFSPLIEFLNKWYPSNHTTVSAQAERVTSLLGVWNGLGTYLMANLLALRAFQSSLHTTWEKCLAVGVFFICAGCLIATSSYASLIGLLLGMFIISYLNRSGIREIVTVISVLGLVAIPLQSTILTRFKYQFGGGDLLPHTFQFRLYVWKDIFWPVVQKNLLWGYHPSISDLAWTYAESNYFSLLLSGGLFALLSHIAWLLISVVWLYKLTKNHNPLIHSLSVSLLSWLIVLSIMAITNEVFTFSGTADYMWIMFGLLAGREHKKL